MTVTVVLTDGPLGPAAQRGVEDEVGAVLIFEGIVRRTENDVPIRALHYEAYEPMAQRQLERIGHEMVRQHGLNSLHVEHSRGVVPVGHCSLRLRVEAGHRAETLEAAAEFINRLKRDVPIWKSVADTAFGEGGSPG